MRVSGDYIWAGPSSYDVVPSAGKLMRQVVVKSLRVKKERQRQQRDKLRREGTECDANLPDPQSGIFQPPQAKTRSRRNNQKKNRRIPARRKCMRENRFNTQRPGKLPVTHRSLFEASKRGRQLISHVSCGSPFGDLL